MKILLIIFAIIILIFIGFQIFLLVSTNKTEQRKYTVVLKEKSFEIRFYPSALFATINSGVRTYKELSTPGFRKLADYIFGNNETGEKIAMTTPVQMDFNDTVSSMSFVMPAEYNENNLPKPNNPEVKIEKTKEEYIAAIRFGGFASDEDISEYSQKLKKILEDKKIRYHGNFRFLGYNPPFQLTGRRNEIIVSVIWNQP
ncbi:MAG: heme-binding protein [Saprospiraceae bacterium]|nr:heme-binding protein [Saprospiraceae bacterium]